LRLAALERLEVVDQPTVLFVEDVDRVKITDLASHVPLSGWVLLILIAMLGAGTPCAPN